MNSLSRGIATAACLAALVATAGCGSAAPARRASTAVTASAVPLGTSMTTTAGTWATVVMGGSAAQHNNFWQLFIRPAGAARWKLVTPPGTADNGGLVLAGGAGQALITAFRPSQDLTYTPLTRTGDAGRTWTALNPLNGPLAATPDALTVQPGTGRLLVLLASGAAEQGTADGASWTTLTTARALAATAAGRSCGLAALTGVTYTPAGSPLLAGSCSRPGRVGIFAVQGHTWHTVGPALPGALRNQPVTVLRLASSRNQITALLAAGTGQHTALMAAWSASHGSRWTTSAPLRAGRHQVTAATLGPGHMAAVITAGSRAAELVNGRWQQLPALPAGTAVIAPGVGDAVDALAVRRATLTVWELAGERGKWARRQVVTVPILYGSSG